MSSTNEPLRELLGRVMNFGGHLPSDVPTDAQTDPREELLVRYCIGAYSFSANHRYLSIRTRMFKPDGTPDGHHEGIYELLYEDLSEISERPAPPVPPFSIPAGPVEHIPARAYSKGTWTFRDGSSLTAVGPANLHAAMLPGGATQLWVTANQIITNGTLQYEGAHGLKTAGDASLLPKRTRLATATEFPAKTVDVFRIVRDEFIFHP